MAARLTSRVEKLEGYAGATKRQKVLLLSIRNWPTNLPDERAKAIRASFLGEIEGHETADKVIFVTSNFVYQDEGNPELDGYEWKTWVVS